jgi:hypothetical protein
VAGDAIEVSGRVTRVEKKLPSGERYPSDLQDAPAMFEITALVQEANGVEVERKITYIAYPPSPMSDAQRRRIRLSFHQGTIRVGHNITARGTFDVQSNAIRVGEEGDFIQTR